MFVHYLAESDSLTGEGSRNQTR